MLCLEEGGQGGARHCAIHREVRGEEHALVAEEVDNLDQQARPCILMICSQVPVPTLCKRQPTSSTSRLTTSCASPPSIQPLRMYSSIDAFTTTLLTQRHVYTESLC
jgi:hypothetical protein